MGMAGFTQTIMAHTMFQLLVPTQYLGRVVSLWGVNGGLISVASLPMGMLGEEVGLRWAFGVAAALLIPITIWLGIMRKPLRKMPEEEMEPVSATLGGLETSSVPGKG